MNDFSRNKLIQILIYTSNSSSLYSLKEQSKNTRKYTSENKVLRAETCPSNKSADLCLTFTWLSFLSLGSSPSISPGDSCLSRLSVSPGTAHITSAGRQKQSDPHQNQQPIITSHGPKHWSELSVMFRRRRRRRRLLKHHSIYMLRSNFTTEYY